MKSVKLLGLGLSLLLASCMGPDGPDGKNGNAYLQITSSDNTLIQFTSYGNSGLPGTFSIDTYYQIYPGSYNYSYSAGYTDNTGTYYSDSWSGTYTVSINYGTKGGPGKIFWQPGDPGQNGTDEYYTMDCTYSGCSFTGGTGTFAKKSAPSVRDTLVPGRTYTQDFYGNKYKIHLEYKLERKSETPAASH